MSLFGRLVLLCGLVAVLAVSVCAWASIQTTSLVLEEQERITGERAAAQFQRNLRSQLDILAFEVKDYASWDELYRQSPHPTATWARVNLIPGADPGRLTQCMVLVDQGQVMGRYNRHGPRAMAPDADDPAPAEQLVALTRRSDGGGILRCGGTAALWASAPILHSDGSGPARGSLVALAYLTPRVVERLAVHGWNWQLMAPDEAPPPRTAAHANQVVTVQAGDQELRILLTRPRQAEAALYRRTLGAISLAGAAVALVAIGIGVLLGWHWLRPLHELAEACRRRALGLSVALPDGGDLPETRVLATDLARLVELERQARERLTLELAHSESANKEQRSWLTRLAHDVGSPVHTVAEIARHMEASGGLLPPESVARLRQASDALLGRIEDAVGLVEGRAAEREPGNAIALADYAAAVADLLQAKARERNVQLAVAATGSAILDASLVTPVLVNLLANAIQAAPPGTVVQLSGQAGEAALWWEVTDAGPGLDTGLAARVTRACERGEVVPGETGIGLGLGVAVTNTTRAGGRLRFATGAGGTTVRLELPCARETARKPLGAPAPPA